MAAALDDSGSVASLEALVFRSQTRTRDAFLANVTERPSLHQKSQRTKLATKIRDEYDLVRELADEDGGAEDGMATTSTATTTTKVKRAGGPSSDMEVDSTGPSSSSSSTVVGAAAASTTSSRAAEKSEKISSVGDILSSLSANDRPARSASSSALTVFKGTHLPGGVETGQQLAVRQQMHRTLIKPEWHAPWKLMRVIAGHLGWVRCVAVDPSNQWFATGAGDRTIKVWDLASGQLQLTLTGHISTVRGLAVSDRHPYLFSCGEDKMVKCWDLEQNKVVRQYHGHLSGVYCMSFHPTVDVLVTGGRDSVARVWDIRTKTQICVLGGHKNTVYSVATQATDPQVITGSMDSTMRLWDLVAGKTKSVITNHKKSVRSVVCHPTEYSFVSASADNIKKWKCPEGKFMQNMSNHHAIINCLAVNNDGVMASGGDDGSLLFWDYKSGHNFQQLETTVQPGSLESEAGIFACSFDRSGSRLITCEADKSIKVYREDETATEETHPVRWRPDSLNTRGF